MLPAVATASLVAVTAAPALGATSSTFTCTDNEQTYSVPTGATAVTVTAVGGKGDDFFSADAGYGASVTATVPITSGTSTLYVEVGCNGFFDAGGFNGGGSSLDPYSAGGAGGGASDVRTASRDTTALGTTDTRLVVAGGGGGGGSQSTTCSVGTGGSAGDTSATGPGNGGAANSGCHAGDNGGSDGSAGGSGGLGSGGCNGNPGTLGEGGDAPNCSAASVENDNHGGAGGGGYYGGGSGGLDVANPNGTGEIAGGGGGAGSSFWVTGATGTSIATDTTGTPEVVITPVIPLPDLGVILTDSPDPVVSGHRLTYTITVTNNGSAQATGVVVTDTLPASTVFNSMSTSQGTCTRTTTTTPKSKNGTVRCTLGSLAKDASATITIVVTPTKKGTLTDTASATETETDNNSSDNSSTATTAVLGG